MFFTLDIVFDWLVMVDFFTDNEPLGFVPWFRVHMVVYNDPGRLISVHLVHTALVTYWAGTMTFYELGVTNNSEQILNPFWRQGSLVIPMMMRLGITASWKGWNITNLLYLNPGVWSFEGVAITHYILAFLLFLAASWHWVWWDLDLFSDEKNESLLDLPKIFGIHLTLASILAFTFGTFHLTGVIGPGFWINEDSYGLVGNIQGLAPELGFQGFNPFNPTGIVSHHIFSGIIGILASVFHLNIRPALGLYRGLRMNDIETVLSSSIAAVFFSGFIVAGTMWYGSATSPISLFGPTRYQWDSGFFQQHIENLVEEYYTRGFSKEQAWSKIPDRLAFYDYIGNNPGKGGLFRAGSMTRGDGVAKSWVGHVIFEDYDGNELIVRRIPTFYETFPLMLTDKITGNYRVDIPFRRAESKYSVEQVELTCKIYGGKLNGQKFTDSSTVKKYIRRAQLGEIFEFRDDKKHPTWKRDGLFRVSNRGWFTFFHLVFSLLFFFGHLWHGGRTLFNDIFWGIGKPEETIEKVEFGQFKKLGDETTKKSGTI